MPRPSSMSREEKWVKYCPINRDHKTMKKSEFLDKHETGYNDYVSCHVKVHGLEDAVARSWTRKLKEVRCASEAACSSWSETLKKPSAADKGGFEGLPRHNSKLCYYTP